MEVEESAVDGGRVSEGVEIGKLPGLVSVGDFVDALDCAVGALHLLSADTAVRDPTSKHQADCLLPGAHFMGCLVCFHRLFLLGLWLMPAFPYGKRTSCGGPGVGTWSGVSHFTPSPTTTGYLHSHAMRAWLRCFPKGVPASLAP